MRIKTEKIGDHEVKILNVPNDNTIFLLRDINSHSKIQSILKSFEKASRSKINFQKKSGLMGWDI